MELKSIDNSHHYDLTRKKAHLRSAWKKVYANGIKSQSPETRNEIKEFEERASQCIDRICRQLLKRKFKFSAAKGVPIPRPGKESRPIVIAPIEDRIVKRSILDTLQEEPKLQPYFLTPTSFGGIKDDSDARGVKNAVKKAYESMIDGSSWFICSDIRNFFSHIPKQRVLDIISREINDEEFKNLLKDAVTVELKNLAELGIKKDLFPTHEIGVAQGCSLSPLMGNILLYDFDIKMNGRGITCLRYIDDFLILGPTRQRVEKAFQSAKKFLDDLGFTVYDPFIDKKKAAFGLTKKGFEYLGCEILPGLIRPSKKARISLLEKIDEITNISIFLMRDPKGLFERKLSLIQTFTKMSNIIIGWGKQYSFCNDPNIMNNLDNEINKRITKYLQKYMEAKKEFNNEYGTIRRLLGIQLLADCRPTPIIHKDE